MMNEATNDALSDTKSGGSTSPLTSEFSKLNGNIDFSHGWTQVTSIHGASSFERAIPGDSGMVVKVYIGDRNFGGANTVTITAPTYSVDHIVGVLPYELGLPVNARNAAVYLSSRNGC